MKRLWSIAVVLVVVAIAVVVIGLGAASSPVHDALFPRTPDPPVVSCPVPGLPSGLIPSQCLPEASVI